MTRYAAVVAIAFAVRALTGSPAETAYAAAVVLLAGLILEGGYRIGLRHPAEMPADCEPFDRKTLDTIVRRQWVGAGLVGLAVWLMFGPLDVGSVDPGRFFGAVITAGTVAIGAIFVSSLIDWYWILPRVSGIVRKAPCREAGGQLWRG